MEPFVEMQHDGDGGVVIFVDAESIISLDPITAPKPFRRPTNQMNLGLEEDLQMAMSRNLSMDQPYLHDQMTP